MSDAPIHPVEYLHGVKVVDIGDLRVARGKTRRERSSCEHIRLVYDPDERRVWCSDCESEVEPFDAFEGLVKRFATAVERLDRRIARVKDAESFAVRSRAAKAMDEVWRSRNSVPLCPHCRVEILPEDVAGGVLKGNKEFALRKRNKRTERQS